MPGRDIPRASDQSGINVGEFLMFTMADVGKNTGSGVNVPPMAH